MRRFFWKILQPSTISYEQGWSNLAAPGRTAINNEGICGRPTKMPKKLLNSHNRSPSGFFMVCFVWQQSEGHAGNSPYFSKYYKIRREADPKQVETVLASAWSNRRQDQCRLCSLSHAQHSLSQLPCASDQKYVFSIDSWAFYKHPIKYNLIFADVGPSLRNFDEISLHVEACWDGASDAQVVRAERTQTIVDSWRGKRCVNTVGRMC